MKTTTRRTFLASAATLGAAAALSRANAGDSPHYELPPLIHNVYFWLKRPDSEEDRQALIAGLKTLADIDTVRGIHIGLPASTEERDVVDNSYQVSETLLFDSVEGQDAYQAHPIHKKFVEDYSHLWRKVVVYDSMAV